MLRMTTTAAAAVAGLAVALVPQTLARATDADGVIASVKYVCAGGKTVDATYFADKVDLVLSDGRSLTVPQAISGSGTRYATADESFVFWSKGDTAFIAEGDPDKPTFDNCIDETRKT